MSRHGELTYLDVDRLDALDARAFRGRQPYPWVNPEGLLTPTGYQRLIETRPDVSLFTPSFGVPRAHGQTPHDRYALEYDERLAVAEPWHAFVRELKGPVYLRFLRRMLGQRFLRLSYHWHYTPNGCSISPHCDAKHKIGSHIFYFNTAADWDPSWGGETLVLDDGGRFPRRSAPPIEAFDRVTEAEALGNRSLLFARGASSWHGMREIHCPPGQMRKVFIVVINDLTLALRREVVQRLRGQAVGGY